ncbi:GNAT family N-acetyltransferase [Alteribacillus sp. HJP-4]|uniref:GNAT family N-acetyltransferase n=1 Tax=Alteribacillus sp. HJP-4 TaxID=2775394 RepID=UPI0035CD1912
MPEVKKVDSQQQLHDAYKVRYDVFVREQQVPEEEELDQYEETAIHYVMYDDNTPIGAGRFRDADGYAKVERICVLASHRHTGSGRFIMDEIELEAKRQGYALMKLNAQIQAAGFYEKLGYSVTSDEFLDAGIPHVEMKKKL